MISVLLKQFESMTRSYVTPVDIQYLPLFSITEDFHGTEYEVPRLKSSGAYMQSTVVDFRNPAMNVKGELTLDICVPSEYRVWTEEIFGDLDVSKRKEIYRVSIAKVSGATRVGDRDLEEFKRQAGLRQDLSASFNARDIRILMPREGRRSKDVPYTNPEAIGLAVDMITVRPDWSNKGSVEMPRSTLALLHDADKTLAQVFRQSQKKDLDELKRRGLTQNLDGTISKKPRQEDEITLSSDDESVSAMSTGEESVSRQGRPRGQTRERSRTKEKEDTKEQCKEPEGQDQQICGVCEAEENSAAAFIQNNKGRQFLVFECDKDMAFHLEVVRREPDQSKVRAYMADHKLSRHIDNDEKARFQMKILVENILETIDLVDLMTEDDLTMAYSMAGLVSKTPDALNLIAVDSNIGLFVRLMAQPLHGIGEDEINFRVFPQAVVTKFQELYWWRNMDIAVLGSRVRNLEIQTTERGIAEAARELLSQEPLEADEIEMEVSEADRNSLEGFGWSQGPKLTSTPAPLKSVIKGTRALKDQKKVLTMAQSRPGSGSWADEAEAEDRMRNEDRELAKRILTDPVKSNPLKEFYLELKLKEETPEARQDVFKFVSKACDDYLTDDTLAEFRRQTAFNTKTPNQAHMKAWFKNFLRVVRKRYGDQEKAYASGGSKISYGDVAKFGGASGDSEY